jgi:hypothetical protein
MQLSLSRLLLSRRIRFREHPFGFSCALHRAKHRSCTLLLKPDRKPKRIAEHQQGLQALSKDINPTLFALQVDDTPVFATR